MVANSKQSTRERAQHYAQDVYSTETNCQLSLHVLATPLPHVIDVTA